MHCDSDNDIALLMIEIMVAATGTNFLKTVSIKGLDTFFPVILGSFIP